MRIPRDNIVRAVFPGVELRDASGAGLRTMTGHFAVFDQWTEINSVFEGRFMERISPGAFAKTFKEGRAGMRVLFQHGQDPHIGNKPLGPINTLEEDRTGAYYDVGLLDTSYNRDLLPGLEAGLYGASFRFSVTREDVNKNPKASDGNPDAITERTIREAQVMEFGPVTFPAYAGATAGVRSMTDAFTLKGFTDNPEALRALLDYNESAETGRSSISVPADIPPPEPAAEPVAEAIVEGTDARSRVHQLRVDVAELRAMTSDEPAVMLDADTVEGLGSLIEVIESTCEAMESLIGIEDDTTPDADDATGEMNSEEPVGDVRSEAVSSITNAPPVDGAEAEPHPIRGRRDKHKSYLRKETPSWQL